MALIHPIYCLPFTVMPKIKLVKLQEFVFELSYFYFENTIKFCKANINRPSAKNSFSCRIVYLVGFF